MADLQKPTDEQIRTRAYELYLERGGEPGREEEDWLAAEEELTQLAGTKTSWIGTTRAAEQDLGASTVRSDEFPRRKTAGA